MLNRAVFQGVPASARRSAGVFRQQNRVFTATIAVASQQNSSIDFSNAETAFKTKTTWELMRAWGVFSLSALKPVVNHHRELMGLGDKIVGTTMMNWFLRKSFFGHFCAGVNGSDIVPVVKGLKERGISAILDYSTEADPEEASKMTREQLEAMWDNNVAIKLDSVRAAHELGGLIAVKPSALGEFSAMEEMTMVLHAARRYFRSHASARNYATGVLTEPVFGHQVSFIQWQDCVVSATCDDVKRERMLQVLQPFSPVPLKFSASHAKSFNDVQRRLNSIAASCCEHGVRLMVDAEQTWVQPAIDVCVQAAQKLYNKGPVIVYNTMQAYLTDSASRLELELQRGEANGYKVGIKLVRGAYMVTETALASKLGYKRPIHDTMEATHDNYNVLARKLIDSVKCGSGNAVLATHNEASVRQAVEYMQEVGVGKRDGVSFGQLLGMCDHVSFPLGAAGFDSLKVVPYGPIRVVLPYLVRRAQENSDVLGRAGFETRLIKTTLKTRAVQLVKP